MTQSIMGLIVTLCIILIYWFNCYAWDILQSIIMTNGILVKVIIVSVIVVNYIFLCVIIQSVLIVVMEMCH